MLSKQLNENRTRTWNMRKLAHITDRVDRDICWNQTTRKRKDITEKERLVI